MEDGLRGPCIPHGGGHERARVELLEVCTAEGGEDARRVKEVVCRLAVVVDGLSETVVLGQRGVSAEMKETGAAESGGVMTVRVVCTVDSKRRQFRNCESKP